MPLPHHPHLSPAPPLRHYLPGGFAPAAGLVLLVDADELAPALQRSGMTALAMTAPRLGDEGCDCRASRVVELQKRLLSLFELARRSYPDLPAALVAGGEAAQCALALLRGARRAPPVKALVLKECPADSVPAGLASRCLVRFVEPSLAQEPADTAAEVVAVLAEEPFAS